MTTLKFKLFALSLVLSVELFGQAPEFDLSSYQLPDLRRRALELDVYLSGSHDAMSGRPTLQDNTYNSLYGSTQMGMTHYRNSAQVQQLGQLNIDLSFSLNNSDNNEGNTQAARSIHPTIGYNLAHRRYYENRYFFEADVLASTNFGNSSYQVSSDPQNGETQRHQNQYTSLAKTAIKIGKGRIEQVQDARHAVFLYEALAKAGRVDAAKSSEEILDLARLISEQKNRRRFDSRMRRIAELEAIDSFLVARNYVSKTDGRYFATLADFWDYGGLPVRQSGWRMAVGIAPGAYLSTGHIQVEGTQSINTEGKIHALMGDALAEFYYEKPLNLRWQSSSSAQASYGIAQGQTDNGASSNLSLPKAEVTLRQRFGYYPNTRTQIEFGVLAQYLQVFDQTDATANRLGASIQAMSVGTEASIIYFLSPRAQLYFHHQLAFARSQTDGGIDSSLAQILQTNSTTLGSGFDLPSRDLNTSFSLRLVYSVF